MQANAELLRRLAAKTRSTDQVKRAAGPQMASSLPPLSLIFAICTLPTCLGFWKNEYGVSYAYGLAMAGMGLLLIRASFTTFAVLHAAALLVYGLRLGFFLFWRELSLQRFRDFREKIEERSIAKGGRLKRLPFVLSCSVLYMCMAAPTMVTACTTKPGVLASVLLAIEWAGLGLAAAGDFTKSWVKAKLGEDTLVTSGVFRILRHPNYTGEQLLWTANMLVGFAVAVNNGTNAIKASIGWLLASVIGWIGICFVLAQATKNLEKKQAERYGDLEEFKRWRASSWSGFALPAQDVQDERRGSSEMMQALFGHAEDGNLQAVKECIASGTRVDLQDSKGLTALLIATRQGHQQVVQALLASGADANQSGARRYTPLMYAAIFGRVDVARLLLAQGADASPKDDRGDTALQRAIRERQKEIAEMTRVALEAIVTPVPDSPSDDELKSSDVRDGSLDKLPFDVAHTLARLGYHEAWFAALTRAIRAKEGEDDAFDFYEAAEMHRKSMEEAREAWFLLTCKWTEEEGDRQTIDEIAKEVQFLAQAAAEHCAAVRLSAKDGADARPGQTEAVELYRKFKAAKDRLKELCMLTKALRDNIIGLLWSAGWLGANSVKHHVFGPGAEEEEEEEEDDYDDDNEDDEDEDEEAGDNQYGEDYLGSSDDRVEDLRQVLDCLRACFWKSDRWQGVRLDLTSLGMDEASAELEAIAAVPGLRKEFSHDRALNCVRFIVRNFTKENEVRAALTRAESLELDVVLEVHFVQEEWLCSLAKAAAEFSRCRGVAFGTPVTDFAEAAHFVSNVRNGGLTQERCAIILPLPGGLCVDTEDKWMPSYEKLHECVPAASLPPLLLDGNTLLEISHTLPPEEDGGPTDLQTVLDATSNLRWNFDCIDVATSLSLVVPRSVDMTSGDAGDSWKREYFQRLLSVARDVGKGFFFDSWMEPQLDAGYETALKSYLRNGWIDFAADIQVVQPVGGMHNKTLVYLHGFTCDGYSYLKEAEYFYCKKVCDDDDGDDDDGAEGARFAAIANYEPYPGLKVVLPSAPLRNITCYDGDKNLSWHDYLTDYEGSQEDELNMTDFEEQIRRIHKILDAEVALVGARNVMLGGASQGCAMALHAGLTYPADLGAIVGTMGQVLSFTKIDPEWIARKVPVYNYNGEADSTFPWEQWTKDTWKRLEDAGAEVHTCITPGVDHGEHEDIWLRSFLKEVMPKRERPRAKPKKKGKKKDGKTKS